MTSVDSTEAIVDKDENHKALKKQKKKSVPLGAIFLIGIIVITGLSFYLINNAIGKGARKLSDSYSDSFSNSYNDSYTKIKEAIYDKYEKANHVKNTQTIQIGELKEKADLEVLTISDSVYEIENKDDNKYKITRWVIVPGKCVFTVNLKASEFIRDEARNTITVRIPELKTRTTLDKTNIKELYKETDSILTLDKGDLTKVNTEIVDKQTKQAYLDLRENLQNDPWYGQQAEKSAVTVVTNMIKSLNPDNPDLQIYVEFME